MRHGILPLRIDAASTDGKARVVDTILLDPTALPRSPSDFASVNEAVEANVRILSDSLITDAEVAGIQAAGYRSGYFTGRAGLLGAPGLRERVDAQLREGLLLLIDLDGAPPRARRAGGHRGGGGDSPAKRRRLGGGGADPAGEPPPEPAGGDGADLSHLVKVNVRLRDRGVAVVDEFYVDPAFPSDLPGGDPFSLARSLADDLNLPRHAEVALATTIVEQVHGLRVESSLKRFKPPPPGAKIERLSRRNPSAWHEAP